MNETDQLLFQNHADIYKSLAHPTRLFIVYEIAENKRSVTELAHKVGVDLSTMSKHLEILRSRKIISRIKQGNQVFYRLEFTCILNFFECVNNSLIT